MAVCPRGIRSVFAAEATTASCRAAPRAAPCRWSPRPPGTRARTRPRARRQRSRLAHRPQPGWNRVDRPEQRPARSRRARTASKSPCDGVRPGAAGLRGRAQAIVAVAAAQAVAPGAAVDHVVAAAAVEHVVAGAAAELLAALGAEQRVGAVAAQHALERRRPCRAWAPRRRRPRARSTVNAAGAVDGQRVLAVAAVERVVAALVVHDVVARAAGQAVVASPPRSSSARRCRSGRRRRPRRRASRSRSACRCPPRRGPRAAPCRQPVVAVAQPHATIPRNSGMPTRTPGTRPSPAPAGCSRNPRSAARRRLGEHDRARGVLAHVDDVRLAGRRRS